MTILDFPIRYLPSLFIPSMSRTRGFAILLRRSRQTRVGCSSLRSWGNRKEDGGSLGEDEEDLGLEMGSGIA